MRYLLRQDLLSFGDDFTIKNEAGEPVFQVDGKAFTLVREKLAFEDMQGQELAFIRERIIALTPSYEILRNGEVAAVVKKDLINLFRCGFTVDVPGPDDLEAQGSLLDHEYTFTRGSRTVATVSKRWFSFTDTYGVDIEPGEDPVLILASTVVIDMICHADESKKKKQKIETN
ncbi:MAG: LURP-one-related family protein [Archangium sp.]|nr:LURP-one-related family protein [Archangium sp.]MDP3573603.1 LURP-one-related family protein [Archangium sp.]